MPRDATSLWTAVAPQVPPDPGVLLYYHFLISLKYLSSIEIQAGGGNSVIARERMDSDSLTKPIILMINMFKKDCYLSCVSINSSLHSAAYMRQ